MIRTARLPSAGAELGIGIGAGIGAAPWARSRLSSARAAAGSILQARHSLALLLLLGWLQGVLPRLPAYLGGSEADPAAAASPLEALIVLIAARGVQRGWTTPQGRAGNAAALILALCLAGGGCLAAQAGVILFCLLAAIAAPRAARPWLAVHAALALTVIWRVAGQRLLGGHALVAEAHLAATLGSLFGPSLQAKGNLILAPDGHGIAVLAGCSTLAALPLLILGGAALGLAVRAPAATIWRAGLLTGLAYTGLNLARLAAFALSAPLYHALHGGWGGMGFDAIATALPFLLAPTAVPAAVPNASPSRRAQPNTPTAPSLIPAIALACAIAQLSTGLALSPRQSPSPGSPPTASLETASAQALRTALAQQGWQPARARPLLEDGEAPLLTFTHPLCAEPLAASLIIRPAENLALLRQALGPDLVFWREHRLSTAAPDASLAWRTLAAAAWQRVVTATAHATPSVQKLPPIALRLPRDPACAARAAATLATLPPRI